MIFIIANSLKPFAYESVQVLGLPDGAHFRARFPIKWIQGTLLSNVDKLVGLNATYATRIWETNQILPLRRVKIESVSLIGQILYFTYSLQNLYGYSSGEAARTAQLKVLQDAITEEISSIENGRSSPDGDMFPLIFEADAKRILSGFLEKRDSSTATDSIWMNSVSLLSSFPVYDGIPFFRFLFFQEGSSEPAKLVKGSLDFSASKSYSARILYLLSEGQGASLVGAESRTPDTDYMKNGPYQLTSTSDRKNLVEISPAFTALSGRYDLFEVLIRPISTRNKSFLDTLRFSFDVPAPASVSYRPVFDIPVTFKRDFRGLLLRSIGVLLFLAAALLFSFQNDIRAAVSPKWAAFLGQFSTVFFVLTCLDLIRVVRDFLKDK